MSYRMIACGLAAMVVASPVPAQRRGTVELGAFGSTTNYDNSLAINTGSGGGLRIGAFLDPRWSVEFDASGLSASRSQGFSNVKVTSLASRLTLTPLVIRNTSWFVGAGGVVTDYGTATSYGMSGLLGAKLAIGQTAAIRVDGTWDYMPKRRDTNVGFRAGLSLFRQPNGRVHTVTVAGPPAMAVMHQDSVSAMEQRRLRLIAENYSALRDSLARTRLEVPVPMSSSAALATMQEMIHFGTDSSLLTPSAKVVLNNKLAIFRANPSMRIVIVGNTDERATDSYNLALGGRRADAAKAYLVSQGIDPIRIEIASRGESQPIASGTTSTAQAQNRRAEFRLLVASDYLRPPQK